jgi:hypothetical protein
MENEFIASISVQDYVNGWRLAATHRTIESLDKVLNYLNLTDFKDWDDNTLYKANSTAYINSYFAYQRNEKNIDGVIAKVVEAERYLNLMRLANQNLGELYFKSSEEDFVITDKVKNYIDYIRSKDPLQSPDDKRLLRNHASDYLLSFAKIRDYLHEKGEEILKKTAVVLSVEIVKHDYRV